MSNGIRARQNEKSSIAMLAAQRQMYSEVGKLDTFSVILSVILPLVLAAVQEVGLSWNWIRFLSYGLTIAMLFLSLFISNESDKKKDIAASIQLQFDTYVFNMPWDKKLFGDKKELTCYIADKSKIVLDSRKYRNELSDWYSPAADALPLNKGIKACQRENFHWDAGLRKRYRLTVILIITLLVVLVFFVGFIKNEPFQDLMPRIIFIIPMIRWLITIVGGIKKDLARLNEIDALFGKAKNHMSNLQQIEKELTAHRKNAIKIPNWFYKVFRNNDGNREKSIIEYDLESYIER